MTIRIWHQSFTDLERLPGYAGMLSDHARRIGAPDTTVDLHGVRPDTYPEGVAPVELVAFAPVLEMINVQIVENCVRAEQQGYDAVAISCFLDPGLEMARSLVDIPVVSSCETALLVAAAVGRRFGLITLDDAMVRMVSRLVADYGCRERVACVIPLDPPLTEFDLDKAFQGSPELAERFVHEAGRLVARGVDVVIPAEGVLNTVLVRNQVREVDGVPVLDSYGALLGFAEMLVQLRRRSGLGVGRAGRYARPPTSVVRHLREVTARTLLEAQAR
jgi:allantoin racemase